MKFNDFPVHANQIADLIGTSRSRVLRIVEMTGFPQPVVEGEGGVRRGRRWSLAEVKAWARDNPEIVSAPPGQTAASGRIAQLERLVAELREMLIKDRG